VVSKTSDEIVKGFLEPFYTLNISCISSPTPLYRVAHILNLVLRPVLPFECLRPVLGTWLKAPKSCYDLSDVVSIKAGSSRKYLLQSI
jgi:hypothetical protein